MKINRLLTAALITFSTVLTGCVKESVWDRETGIDESKAAPEEFTYDEEASSATSMTVYWDGKKAIAAGAKSFLIQLTDPTNMDKGDTWNTTTTKVIEITDDESVDCETTTFTGLKEYDLYYVRVRANYPGSVYSPWVYLARENGTPALYQVGHGAVALVPTISLNALVKDIEVAWTYCEGAVKYRVEWKKSSETAWQSTETEATNYTISGLTPETQYDVKVTAITATAENASDVVSATTKEQPPFPMEIATAQAWMDFVNGEFISLANNGADDIVNITADLDFTGIQYTKEVVFKGVINGNNKTIKNLKTSIPFVKEATTIKDITFDSSCAVTATADGKYAMVAYTNKGVFSNITNNANVTVELAEAPSAESPLIAAGIVVEAEAEITGCTNNGAISVSSPVGIECVLVGGICGYAHTKVTNCTNNGNLAITSTHWILTAWTTYQGIEKVAQPMGGIAAMTKAESVVEGCTNNGKVVLSLSSIEKMAKSAGTNRIKIGGIVGAVKGTIKSCTNKGNVELYARTSDRTGQKAASKAYGGASQNYSVAPGGITGGCHDYGSEKDNGMYIIDCVNEGDVIVDADVDGNNATVGGIVSHPGWEDAGNPNTIQGCINRGNITVTGAGKFRVAGINGGTGNIIGCENYGTIKLATNSKGANSDSSVAGISAFLGANMKHENNKNYGDVIEDTEYVHNVGGLIAYLQDHAVNYVVGGVVKCNVTTKSSATTAGMVIGRSKNSGMVVGTTDAPIQVSGTFNGTTIDAGNLATYAQGSTSVAQLNVVLGE